jgi:hypothetical protein
VFYPSELYQKQGEGKSVVEVLRDGESHLATLVPDALGESNAPWNGARLKPVADAFADLVRKSAEDQ